MPTDVPLGLTAEYYEDKRRKTEWDRWLKSQSLPNKTSLPQSSIDIAEMLMPVAVAAAKDQPFPMVWKEGHWSNEDGPAMA